MRKVEKKIIPNINELPDSLKPWFEPQERSPRIEFDTTAREVLDLSMLTPTLWDQVIPVWGNIDSGIDMSLEEARAFRELTTQHQVQEFIIAELRGNQDPYSLLGGRNSMSGNGIKRLYGRLLSQINDLNLSKEDMAVVTERLSLWEESLLNILSDREQYFSKAANGNKGTISEYLGTSLAFSLPVFYSPTFRSGKYREQILAAVDLEGIQSGRYSHAEFDEFYRQEILLHYLFDAQGPTDRFDQSFWRQFESNPDFLTTLHEIAVEEGFSHAQELLLRALELAQKNPEDYKYEAASLVRTHFNGNTAADKFLAEHAEAFKEVFNDSRQNVQDSYLYDQKLLEEKGHDFLVILDVKKSVNTSQVSVNYARVGTTYEEKEVFLDSNSPVRPDMSLENFQLLAMLQELETFKKNFLRRIQR